MQVAWIICGASAGVHRAFIKDFFKKHQTLMYVMLMAILHESYARDFGLRDVAQVRN